MASHSQEDTHNTAPSSESLDLLSPADLVEDSPLFKLPPELRNRIYGHVFGPSRAVNIVRPCWEGYWESQFEYPVGNVGHTSLFAVNRFVKAEAMDVLYGTKVVRGNDLNLQDMLGSHDVAGRVRSIEMTGCLFARHSDVNAAYFSSILRRLRGLSGLRSLVILSDDLSSIVDPSSDAPIPVMDFVKTVEIGPAMCTDIGQYRLHGEFEGVQIVNRKLVEMWPAVRATPEDYSGLDDALAIMASLQAWVKAPNIPTWASHSSLRCWVDIQQQYLEMLKSGKWNKLVRSQGEDGDNHEDGDDDDDDIREFPLPRNGEHVLKDLQPNSDSRLLNEASEFLAVNMGGYRSLSGHPTIPDRWNLFPTIWAETWDDTGKTALEYMTDQQDIAASVGASFEFVLDPVLHNEIPAYNLIDRALALSWLETSWQFSAWLA